MDGSLFEFLGVVVVVAVLICTFPRTAFVYYFYVWLFMQEARAFTVLGADITMAVFMGFLGLGFLWDFSRLMIWIKRRLDGKFKSTRKNPPKSKDSIPGYEEDLKDHGIAG